MTETIEMLRKVSTDTITGVLVKVDGMRSRAIRDVRPIDPRRCQFVGPAYTLRYVPIREDHTANGRSNQVSGEDARTRRLQATRVPISQAETGETNTPGRRRWTHGASATSGRR
jgi:regulator of RNase E activity RraA